MDALDVLKVCLRRWYVVLPVIIVALGAGFGLASQEKPTYTAFASYALVFHSPAESKSSDRDLLDGNPLAGNGAALLGEALAADLMSGPSQRELGGVGNSGAPPGQGDTSHTPGINASYSVSLPPNTEAYLVQTWGNDPEGVRRAVDSVLAAAPAKSIAIQDRAGAPKRSQYTVFTTSSTQVAELPPTSTIKFVVAVVGLGILAGSALSLIVDKILRARNEKRAAKVSKVGSELEDVDLTKDPSAPQVLQIPAILTERQSIDEEGAAGLINSESGEAVTAPTGAPFLARSTQADPYGQQVLQGGGKRQDGLNGKPAAGQAADSTQAFDGDQVMSESIREKWSLPPWTTDLAHGNIDSGTDAEADSRNGALVAWLAPLDELELLENVKQDGANQSNEARASRAGTTQAVNGVQHASNGEISERAMR